MIGVRKSSSPRWPDADGNERGSIAILMMVVLVGAMLSALLVPMVITQSRTTRFDTTRVQALNAAETGIEVALGAIRASTSIDVASTLTYGDSSKLPCGPGTGLVTGSLVAAYSVVVEYFTFDPAVAKDPAVATPTGGEPYPSANAMKCVTGYGTYDPASALTTPKYARFTSTGTVGAASNGSTAGRTLTATYILLTSNVNILGGTMQTKPTTANPVQLCLDAGSATPAVGATVKLQPCSSSTPAAAQQVFAYRSDLTLQLVSSITAANLNGLCLNSANTPARAGDTVKLSLCGPLGSPTPYTEQWSFDDWGQYQAALATTATTGKGVLSTLCMNVSNQAAGQPIVLTDGTCSTQTFEWVPSPSLGPGAAALPQLVNYKEFGRCLDVTATWVDTPFLISFPCKQNPYPAAKTWNQLFTALPIPANQSSVTGTIYTTTGGKNYCLTSPGTSGSYVTVKVCDGRATQTWTTYDGDAALNYSTKFTVVSGALCLGLSAPDPSTPAESAWSTIDVETCTGTPEQKWSANPNVLGPFLQNIQEK